MTPTSEVMDELETQTRHARGAARDLVHRATDRAGDAYAAARHMAVRMDPFVKDRPYAALALALAAGVVVGGLFVGRGPRVIYVRPHPASA